MNTMPYWQIFYYSKICSSHGIWEGRYNELIFSCPIISPTQILLILWSTVHFWYQQCHSPQFFIWTQLAFLSWTQQEMWQSFYGASLMWIIGADSRIVSCQCHHWALAPVTEVPMWLLSNSSLVAFWFKNTSSMTRAEAPWVGLKVVPLLREHELSDWSHSLLAPIQNL